jgi:hypothetical protein
VAEITLRQLELAVRKLKAAYRKRERDRHRFRSAPLDGPGSRHANKNAQDNLDAIERANEELSLLMERLVKEGRCPAWNGGN